jgi:plastocyanin
MSRRLLAPLITAALAIGAIALVPAVALAGDPCFHAFDNRPAPSSGSTSQIVMGDCVFTPTVNSVPVGTTVTWRNGSIQAHEVVGSNMTWGAHDKLLQPGDTIGWTFDTAGTYAYACMIHPGMSGFIVVGDGADAAAPGDVGAVSELDASETPDETSGAGAEPAVAIVGASGGLAVGLLLGALLRRRNRASSAP